MGDGHDSLAAVLGGAPPGAVARLPDADAAVLAGQLEAARTHQSEQFARAVDAGLGFIPRIARGAVKRVLFG